METDTGARLRERGTSPDQRPVAETCPQSDVARTFDDHADAYREEVQSLLGPSGESLEFFAQQKAAISRTMLDDRPIERIIDFGCGIGESTAALASEFPSASILGVDISEQSVARAAATRADESRIAFQSFRRNTLPVEDESFDLAFAACVFHHIESIERPLWVRELRRVLRPGGRLLIFEHNPLNPLTLRVVRNCPFDVGVRLLGARETEHLVAGAGFDVRPARFYCFFPRALRWLRRYEPALKRIPLGAQYVVEGVA